MVFTNEDLNDMEQITVADYAEGGYEDKEVYTATFNGPQLVTGLNSTHGYPSIYCGRDNGGFGMSYAAHFGTVLYVKS